MTKVNNSPDYAGWDKEEAMADIQSRVRKYEEQYETIDDDTLSYIKIYNLSSKMLVNHIYGRMAKSIVPVSCFVMYYSIPMIDDVYINWSISQIRL